MPKITDELHAVVASLEAEGHVLADKARSILNRLRGNEQHLATEAAADAHQVEQDAKPVIAEAEHDVKQLAAEAQADIKDATQTPPTA